MKLEKDSIEGTMHYLVASDSQTKQSITFFHEWMTDKNWYTYMKNNKTTVVDTLQEAINLWNKDVI